MNGQALTKRYEVRDAETGETVTGAYVLVPGEDPYAETAMFAYGSLCGLEESHRRAVAMSADPQDPQGRELLDAIAEGMERPAGEEEAFCDSVDGESFYEQAQRHGGGTIEGVYNLWRSLGLEPVLVVMRVAPQHVKEAAERYREALNDAENARQAVEARRRELAAARGVEVVGSVPDGRGGTADVVKAP